MTSPRRELPLPIVAVVTDRSLFSGLTELYEAVEAAVAGGANLVQLREKDLPDAEQLIIARRLREITAGRALLLVNDSVSVAQAAGADGVQLAETSRSVSDARSRAGGAPLIIGRSVHNDAGAWEASREGVDLLIAGAVFESATHPDQQPAGPEFISELTELVSTPVLGIGGVTHENAEQVINAGASGVAVIRGVLGAADPKSAARELRDAVYAAWSLRQAR